MSLLRLPQDVLAPIFAELEAEALYRLLQTCPRLYWLMTSGNCVHRFSFRFEQFIKRFPPLAFAFPLLREFCVSGERSLPTFTYNDLLKLPKTLQKLELHIPEANDIFLEVYKAVGAVMHWMLPSGLTVDNSPLFNVSRHFTHLSTLILVSESSHPSLKVVSKLPHTLTHLQVFRQVPFSYSYIYSRTPCDAKALPPHLRVLKLYRCGSFTSTTDLSHLTQLEVVHLPHVDMVTGLPTTIKEAMLAEPFEFLRNFVGTLEKLTLLKGPLVCPSSVTDLYIYANPINYEDVKISGRNLTKLRLPYRSNTELLQLSLPPALKSLVVQREHETIPMAQFAPLIPATLEHLELPASILEDADFVSLPSGLKHLGSAITVNTNMNIAEKFPKLEFLVLHLAKDIGKEAISSIQLPPHLLTLNVVHINYGTYRSLISEHLDWKFPETLQSLMLSGRAAPAKNFLAKRLPTGLRKLDLIFKSPISEDADSMDHNDLCQLPRHLTDLTLDLAFPADFSSVFLRHLPSVLTNIHIKGLMTCCDEDMSLLPRTLREFTLRSAHLLTDACAPHLPPKLQTLAVRLNRNLTPAILKTMPASLTMLDVRQNKNWPIKGVAYPQGLQIFSKKYRS